MQNEDDFKSVRDRDRLELGALCICVGVRVSCRSGVSATSSKNIIDFLCFDGR